MVDFSKIYLFNLNTYLGGGEVLAIRMASYLREKKNRR